MVCSIIPHVAESKMIELKLSLINKRNPASLGQFKSLFLIKTAEQNFLSKFGDLC